MTNNGLKLFDLKRYVAGCLSSWNNIVTILWDHISAVLCCYNFCMTYLEGLRDKTKIILHDSIHKCSTVSLIYAK